MDLFRPIKLLLKICALLAAVSTSGCASSELGYRGYRLYLENQEVKANIIPSELIEKIQASYAMPIENVRYFTNVDTLSGNVVTMGNRIYFPRRMQMNQSLHVKRLLHELRHVEQYNRDGEFFFQKYTIAGISETLSQLGSSLERGAIDTHAHFSYEAEAKAAEEDVFGKVKSLCNEQICWGFQ